MVDEKDQIFGKVSEDMDPLKKILVKVPGFGGYIERQKRRDSDKLLRARLLKLKEKSRRALVSESASSCRIADTRTSLGFGS